MPVLLLDELQIDDPGVGQVLGVRRLDQIKGLGIGQVGQLADQECGLFIGFQLVRITPIARPLGARVGVGPIRRLCRIVFVQ